MSRSVQAAAVVPWGLVPPMRLDELLESIAANVRAQRLAAGLTQEQLAEAAELDHRFLQRVERGQTNLSMAVLVALAEALDTKITNLLRPAELAPARRGRPAAVRKRPRPRKS